MKKVLALVLAVIMVCTMAMAISTTTPSTGSTTPPTYEGKFNTVYPGSSIYWTDEELYGSGYSIADAQVANHTVDVTIESGAEKIASKGWVKDTTLGWIYALTTVANDTAALDDKADIVISKVVAGKVGEAASLQTEYKKSNGTYLTVGNNWLKMDAATKTDKMVSVFDYGRMAYDLAITDPMTIATSIDCTLLYNMVKGGTGVAFPASADVAVVGTPVVNNNATNKTYYSYTLKAGEKVLFSKVPAYEFAKLSTSLQNEVITKDVNVYAVIGGTDHVLPNKAVKITVDNQKEGAVLYMVNADGSLTNLNAKFDGNKVLTATAKVTGPVVVADKALTASNTVPACTTTNPGTGANDVVGVAAALAVVALVSGAAISLKK